MAVFDETSDRESFDECLPRQNASDNSIGSHHPAANLLFLILQQGGQSSGCKLEDGIRFELFVRNSCQNF